MICIVGKTIFGKILWFLVETGMEVAAICCCGWFDVFKQKGLVNNMKCRYFDICPVHNEYRFTCNDPYPEPSSPLEPLTNIGQVTCIPLLLEAYHEVDINILRKWGKKNGC